MPPLTTEREQRRRAIGDADKKICVRCSRQFQYDVHLAAEQLGETTEYYAFRALWERYWQQRKLVHSRAGQLTIAVERCLSDRTLHPIVREYMEKLLETYLPNSKPVKKKKSTSAR